MNNDEHAHDEFEHGSDDLDTDFGEFDQESGKRPIGEVIRQNTAVKIGLVVGALAVVVGAIMLFGGPKVKGPDSNVVSGNDLKQAPGTKELSPEMKQVIDEVNQKNVEEAQRTGASAIPQPTDTPKEQLQVPADEASAEDPLARWRDMQAERAKAQAAQPAANPQQQQQDQAAAQAQTALATSMTAQMSEILTGKKIENLKSMQVTSLADLLAAQQKNAGGQEAGQGTAAGAQGFNGGDANSAAALAAAQAAGIDPMTGQPLKPAKILLPAGAIEYGQLLIEANSDVPGPVVSLIVSGPFAGSRVLGTFTRQQEYLVIEFKTLVNKKGVSIPIDAFALDPDTTLTGMATDVDHRYFERIVLPAAAEFVEGVGEAYANKEGQTTVVTGDVVVQSQPTIDFKEQLANGIQKGAERAGDVLTEEGNNTQPLVIVKAGTPMGILFMTPISDQDFIAGNNNPATARVLQQQQQQNLLQQQFLQQSNLQNPLYSAQGLQAYGAPGNAAPVYGTNAAGYSSGAAAGAYPGGVSPYNTDSGTGRAPSVFSTRSYLNGN